MVSLRSLSELESIKPGGETSDKIRQVTERATLFRITSNAMINVRKFYTSTSFFFLLVYTVKIKQQYGLDVNYVVRVSFLFLFKLM